MACFSRTNPRNPLPVVSHSRTTMAVHTLEHYWTIENFSKCHQREATYLDSGPFFEDPKYKFFLRLYPIGDADDKETRKHISMYLNFRSGDSKIEAATVGCKFAILNRIGSKAYKIEFKHRIANGSGWGWRKFLKRSSIVDCCALTRNLLPGFLPNDELTIYCEVTYVSGIVTEPAPLMAPVAPARVKLILKKQQLDLSTTNNKDKKVEGEETKEEQKLKKVDSQASLDTLQSYWHGSSVDGGEASSDAENGQQQF